VAGFGVRIDRFEVDWLRAGAHDLFPIGTGPSEPILSVG
jgi:hypothetical protein